MFTKPLIKGCSLRTQLPDISNLAHSCNHRNPLGSHGEKPSMCLGSEPRAQGKAPAMFSTHL